RAAAPAGPTCPRRAARRRGAAPTTWTPRPAVVPVRRFAQEGPTAAPGWGVGSGEWGVKALLLSPLLTPHSLLVSADRPRRHRRTLRGRPLPRGRGGRPGGRATGR